MLSVIGSSKSLLYKNQFKKIAFLRKTINSKKFYFYTDTISTESFYGKKVDAKKIVRKYFSNVPEEQSPKKMIRNSFIIPS